MGSSDQFIVRAEKGPQGTLPQGKKTDRARSIADDANEGNPQLPGEEGVSVSSWL
jgi:hypothetical protein